MQQPNVLFIDLIYGAYKKNKNSLVGLDNTETNFSFVCNWKKMAHKFKEIKCRIAVTGPKASKSEQINCERGLCVSLHGEVFRKFLYAEQK